MREGGLSRPCCISYGTASSAFYTLEIPLTPSQLIRKRPMLKRRGLFADFHLTASDVPLVASAVCKVDIAWSNIDEIP